MTHTPALRALAALPLLVSVIAGCDTGGIYPLRSRSDVLKACQTPTSTWLRTTDAPSVEMLIIGQPVPTSPTVAGTEHCFMRMVLEQDSSTLYEAGSYVLDASGTGTFFVDTTYDYELITAGLFSRRGADQTRHGTAIEQPLTIAPSGNRMLVSIAGTQHVYRGLPEVLASANPSTQQGAEQMYLLINLPLMSSYVRVEGFGGYRMSMYAGTNKRFDGAIANDFRLSVQSVFNPVTELEYYRFQDATGIVFDGLQVTNVNAQGNGPMRGTLTWEVENPDISLPPLHSGEIDYDAIRITDGFTTSGHYTFRTLTPTQTEHDVTHMFSRSIDLRPLIPVTLP